MIRLGAFTFAQPLIVLAPMAGVSDLPFRRLCQHFGADYTVAEMVAARTDLLDTELSRRRLSFDADPHVPRVLQLLGNDPRQLADSAARLADSVDVIDLNLGCPAKQVAKKQAGSGLLRDLKLVEKIFRALRAAVSLPLTVKTRLGDQDKMAIHRVAQLALDNGFSLLALHGRTRAQRFSGPVDYELMGEIASRYPLPLLANGDITEPEQAAALLRTYPYAGLMLGRACWGQPQLFARCQNLINGRRLPERLTAALVQEHLRQLWLQEGDRGLLLARKHLHQYCRRRPDYEELRPLINGAGDLAAQLALAGQFLD